MNCRACTDLTWIKNIFSVDESKPGGRAITRPSSSAPGRGRKRDLSKFEPRDLEGLKKLVTSWEPFVHPRAREFFPSQEILVQVLTQLAQAINKDEDPILGGEENCVHWYGEVTKDAPVAQAAIRMMKPGESSESVTFVNRVLVFVFATDDSFEQLMKLPKEPFKTVCGEQLCVNLNHISTSMA